MGTDLDIPTLDCSNNSYKVSRYDKIHEYCTNGYIICEDDKGELVVAINDRELISKLSSIRDVGHSISLIKDKDFNRLLKSEFGRYNASRAKYHLDFISPISATKNIRECCLIDRHMI